jgi:hypothetical protein
VEHVEQHIIARAWQLDEIIFSPSDFDFVFSVFLQTVQKINI